LIVKYILPLIVVFLIGCDKKDTPVVTPISDPIVIIDSKPIIEEPIIVVPIPTIEEPIIVVVPEPISEPTPPEDIIIIPQPVLEPIIIVPEFDSKFKCRIIYEDGSPYTDGLVKLEGDGWTSYSPTDANGIAITPVVGDERFKLSALSPWDEEERYIYYNRPLLVEQYETSEGIVCDLNKTIEICIEEHYIP